MLYSVVLVSAVQQMNQLCVSICPTVLDFLPINVTTENWVEFSVLYSGFSLVIYFIYHSLAQLLQSCPTLYNSMDCSPPGSSVHGILQAQILEWVAIPFFRGSSQPRMKYASLMSPALAGMFFTTNATWEAPSGSLDNHIWMIWSVWPPDICWLSIHIKIRAPYTLPCGYGTWRTVSSLISDLLCCG